MTEPLSRRAAVKQLGAAGASVVLGPRFIQGQAADIMVAGAPVEIAVWSLSATTVRLTVRPIRDGQPTPIASTGALAREESGSRRARATEGRGVDRVRAGDLVVRFTESPPTIHVDTADGRTVQRLTLSATTPRMSFLLPSGPLLGLGEGGAQFDRKGSVDAMRNGQGAFRLATHGTRAPVQWLLGTTEGWAMFIHQPYGAFDLTGSEGVFTPASNAPGAWVANAGHESVRGAHGERNGDEDSRVHWPANGRRALKLGSESNFREGFRVPR